MAYIRKAIVADKDIIQNLNQQIFDFENANCDPFEDIKYPQSESGHNFYSDIVNEKNGHFGYVFEDDEGIIRGYVSLRVQNPREYQHRKDICILQLQTLGVDKNYRNQGIGSKLIKHAQTVAKELGFTHLRVIALAKNGHARHVYQECGFHEQEIIHEMKL